MSNLISVCCGADKYEDLEMCSMCMEWADFEGPEKRAIQNMDGTVEYFNGEY